MSTIDDARAYVGTTPLSGLSQFALLARIGVGPFMHVMEIGCGALHLMRPLAAALDPGHYVGVDPNVWLRDAAVNDDLDLGLLIAARRVRFSARDDFYADDPALPMPEPAATGFDRIVSHSVLTHAARWQLPAFMAAVDAQLADVGGAALVSVNLADVDTAGEEWTYPGAVTFCWETIVQHAHRVGLAVLHRPDFTAQHRAYRPDETHDWLVLHRG